MILHAKKQNTILLRQIILQNCRNNSPFLFWCQLCSLPLPRLVRLLQSFLSSSIQGGHELSVLLILEVVSRMIDGVILRQEKVVEKYTGKDNSVDYLQVSEGHGVEEDVPSAFQTTK